MSAPQNDPGNEHADPLRDSLFAAAGRRDGDELARIIDENEEAIVAAFAGWQKVPAPIQDDPESMQAYAQGLLVVAGFFAQVRKRPELLERLTGGGGEGGENPLTVWQDQLEAAQKLREQLEFAEGISALSDLLVDMRDVKGSGVDHFLPRTLGMLGDLHFQNGQLAPAFDATRGALEACERAGDEAGILTYLSNLYELHRYEGETERAAECAERLAARFEGADRRWYEAQARILRAGEPLLRVVSERADGCRAEVADTELAGHVRFVFQRNRISRFAANVWGERGENHGRKGELEEALAAFREAADADDYTPEPRYQAAATCLFLGRFGDAAEWYREVEERAPGWFHCRANLWLADEATRGALSQETLLLILELSDRIADPERDLARAEAARDATPQVALLHLIAARALLALERPDEGRAALEVALERAEDDDVRTRTLLERANATEDAARREERLRETAAVGGNLVAAATAELLLRGDADGSSAEGEPAG